MKHTLNLSAHPLKLCAVSVVLLCVPATFHAQTISPALSTDAQQISNIEQRLNDVTTTLTQTQKALQDSQLEIQRLRAELDALKKTAPGATPAPETATTPAQPPSASVQSELDALKEQQEILAAEVAQHEQTKVETSGKYGLRVMGLALFNAYSTAGVTDTAELPAIALPRPAGSSHGAAGADLRQTLLGLEATGPAVFGAHTLASINMDFFGGATTNSYGYTALSGVVRLRDAAVNLDWSNTSLQLGNTEPLITPLSPTSYATVAMPAFAGSGNLWAWAPQIRVEHRLSLGSTRGLSLQGGVISPQSPNYYTVQFDSPLEASRRPGVEGRIGYLADRTSNASPRSLAFGVGAYTADQEYSASTRVHSWAGTADWKIPILRHIDFSGELYRGRALGGFGGGLYKDALIGTDPVTGVSKTVGVETAGGWTQFKLTFTPRIQANMMFGTDQALSRSFDAVLLPASSSALTYNARNSSFAGNLVFRPFSSIIFSPEYRHIETWRYSGTPNVANVFTLSAGYQF